MTSKAEKDIQKKILSYAKNHPAVAWIDRANSGKVKVKGGWMQLHENGTPDLIGYSVTGLMIGIEVKDENNFNSKNYGLRPEQIERLHDMRLRGCICGVSCSIDHTERILNGEYIM
jgi:hypothetical protein